MIRRRELWVLPWLPAAVLRAQGAEAVRGRVAGDMKLRLADGRVVALSGDTDSTGVLRDERLAREEFELRGRFTAPDSFSIDPIHLRAIFVWRGGKKFVVTYWCDVCAIRAWTPGKCQCCQDEMALDLRDPALKET
ncbi:MAG: hypothetical protein IPP47_24005 [Bryobacterales bacterium]|nr:hypothetical protein [Bryobacterales bacterium]